MNTTGGSNRPSELLQTVLKYSWHLGWGDVVVGQVMDKKVDEEANKVANEVIKDVMEEGIEELDELEWS